MYNHLYYWKKVEWSSSLPFVTFHENKEGIYLVTLFEDIRELLKRGKKIQSDLFYSWSSSLKTETREFIFIFVLIKFDRRELKTISRGIRVELRSAFRSLSSSREGRNRKSKNRRQREETAFPRRRLSVIVTSAFQGNEPRFTEVTVPLIERPAPPGSRPLPNNLVPIPSSTPFPFVSQPFHSFDDRPISLSLSLLLVSYPFSQQRKEVRNEWIIDSPLR